MTLRFHWGTGIAIVYTTFALATMAFVAFAMSKPVDLVSADYYDDALNHDANARARAHAEALGDAFDVTLDEPARRVVVSWPVATAAGLRGTATFYRPSSAGLDRQVTLAPDRSGHQALSVADLAPGRWQLRLSWQVGGQDYLVVRDLHLR